MSKLDKHHDDIIVDLANGISKASLAAIYDVPVTTLKDWVKRNTEPTGLQKVLIVPDVHVPYHDKRAWNLFLKVAAEFKPDILVCMGDLLDMYTVSTFSKDPSRKASLGKEIKAGNKALDQLDALGATRKMFVEGNHEFRLARYLLEKAPELFDFVSIPKLLGLDKRGWEFTPYKNDTKLGKLYVTHDVGMAGRYAVQRSLDVYQHSVVTAHTHRLGLFVEGNAAGEHAVSFSPGWLGDVEQVDYMHRTKAKKDWTLGYGIGYMDPKTDLVYLTPVPIINYTCLVNGTLYKG